MVRETWHDLAQEFRRAANKLVADEPRSCVSPAYYAVYARVTHELARLPNVAFAAGREGPGHPGPGDGHAVGDGGIRRIVVEAMTQLPIDQRRKLSELIGELYRLRLYADYRPSQTVSHRSSRRALALVRAAFDIL